MWKSISVIILMNGLKIQWVNMGSFSPWQVKQFKYLIYMEKPFFFFGAYYKCSADSPVQLQIRELLTGAANIKNGSGSTVTEGYALAIGY